MSDMSKQEAALIEASVSILDWSLNTRELPPEFLLQTDSEFINWLVKYQFAIHCVTGLPIDVCEGAGEVAIERKITEIYRPHLIEAFKDDK